MDAEWIRSALLAQPSKTKIGLALALGLDPAAVTRILKGERKIKAQEIPVIRAYFEMPDEASSSTPARNVQGSRGARSLDHVPVMGTAECGKDGVCEWNGEVVDQVQRPPALSGSKDGYALYVSGESMVERYYPGELVFVHPGKPVMPGHFVVAQFREAGEGGAPRALIKQLKKKTASAVMLHQFNPRKDIEIPLSRLVSLHRIVGTGEA